jgi:hypothetical protein
MEYTPGSNPSPTTRTSAAVIFSLMRWASSFFIGPLLKPRLYGLGFGPPGLFAVNAGFCPPGLNGAAMVTSVFLVYIYFTSTFFSVSFLKSLSISCLMISANSSMLNTPKSPLPCLRTATFLSATSFSPTISM